MRGLAWFDPSWVSICAPVHAMQEFTCRAIMREICWATTEMSWVDGRLQKDQRPLNLSSIGKLEPATPGLDLGFILNLS